MRGRIWDEDGGFQSEFDIPDDLIEYVDWLGQYRQNRDWSLALIEVLRAGKSRVEQLRRYNEKRKNPDATFRPYAPLKLSAGERGNLIRAARAEGIATLRDPRPWQCPATQDGRRCLKQRDHTENPGEQDHRY